MTRQVTILSFGRRKRSISGDVSKVAGNLARTRKAGRDAAVKATRLKLKRRTPLPYRVRVRARWRGGQNVLISASTELTAADERAARKAAATAVLVALQPN